MAEMGRPKIEIDFNQLKALMRMKPSAEDCAAFFKCAVATIERRIREATVSEEFTEGLTFAEFRDQNMVHTRFSIIRNIIKKAESGDNVMLIYASKNLCGWSDKQADVNVTVQNSVSGQSQEDLERKKQELEEKWKAELLNPSEPEGETS